MRRNVTTIAAAALATAIWCGPAAAADEVKIGLMLPYKGVFAQLAVDIERAWILELERRNYTAGGKKIVLIKEDTEADPTVGVRKASRLIDSEKVDVMTGIVSSGVALGVSDIALRRKKPLVLANAVTDELTGEKCHPYIARTSFSAHALESASGAYWATKYKTAVTLGPDYTAGRAFIQAFINGFKKGGGTVKEEMWSVFRQTRDWAPLLTKAKDSGAEILYAWYAGAESIQAVKQHAAFGLREKMPLLGTQWLYDQELWPAMGEDTILGSRYITVYSPSIDTPTSKRFVEAYAKKYGQPPNVTAATGYDNAIAVLGAIDALKGNVSDGKVFIEKLTSLTLDSPRGAITFSKSNNAQMKNVFLVEIAKQNGKLAEKMIAALPPGEDLPGCKMK